MDKGESAVFLGYGESGYKLYNPITKKVFFSRDVKFDEYSAWDWKEKFQEKGILLKEEEESSIPEYGSSMSP